MSFLYIFSTLWLIKHNPFGRILKADVIFLPQKSFRKTIFTVWCIALSIPLWSDRILRQGLNLGPDIYYLWDLEQFHTTFHNCVLICKSRLICPQARLVWRIKVRWSALVLPHSEQVPSERVRHCCALVKVQPGIMLPKFYRPTTTFPGSVTLERPLNLPRHEFLSFLK